MSNDEAIDSAVMSVLIRTLDSWFLMHPALTHDAVSAWLESIEAHDYEQPEPAIIDALDATEISPE